MDTDGWVTTRRSSPDSPGCSTTQTNNLYRLGDSPTQGVSDTPRLGLRVGWGSTTNSKDTCFLFESRQLGDSCPSTDRSKGPRLCLYIEIFLQTLLHIVLQLVYHPKQRK